MIGESVIQLFRLFRLSGFWAVFPGGRFDFSCAIDYCVTKRIISQEHAPLRNGDYPKRGSPGT